MACPCRPLCAFDDTSQVAVPLSSVHLTARIADIHPGSKPGNQRQPLTTDKSRCREPRHISVLVFQRSCKDRHHRAE